MSQFLNFQTVCHSCEGRNPDPASQPEADPPSAGKCGMTKVVVRDDKRKLNPLKID